MTTPNAYYIPNAKQQFINYAGQPLAGCSVYMYVPGTTTFKNTWKDSSQTTLNTNPILLDSNGEAVIYGTGSYRQVVYDAGNNLVWDQVVSEPVGTLLSNPQDISNQLVTPTGSPTSVSLGKLASGLGTSVMYYGATGNGVTDDTSAIASANTAGACFLPAGTYVIGSNLTLTNQVTFAPGAKLQIATGKTVAINGGIQAGLYQIFTGTGTVTFAPQTTPDGYPEWWGALINNSGFDCSTAINACIVACPVTWLQAGTYYTANTILHQVSNRTVIGAMMGNVAGNTIGSIILINSATATIYKMGPNTFSGSFTQTNSILKYVTLGRTVAPNIASACNGLLVQYTVWSDVEEVYAFDSIYNFHILGTGDTRLKWCVSARYQAGSGGGTDVYYGFYVDGSTNIGAAGGNASLYMDKCVAGSNITWTSSINYQGLVAVGTYGYSDLYINQFETSNLGIGINLVGNSNTSTTYDYKNEDVVIIFPVLDTCSVSGIQFTGTSLYGAVTVLGGYIAFNPSASSPSGLYYTNSQGWVSVQGVQILCGTCSGAIGVVTSGTNKGIFHKNNLVYECAQKVYTISGTSNSRFEDQIRNYSVAASANPAVQVSGSCSRNVFAMSIAGKSGAFSQGYYLSDATTSYSEFACSGVDQTPITAWKLNNNGTQISAAGTFGTTNLASGIMN